MLMCIPNLVRFCQFFLKLLSGNELLTSIKGRNSVKILRKMTGYNPKLSEGRDVFPCDFRAKIDFFALNDCMCVMVMKNDGVQFFRLLGPVLYF